MLSTLGSNYNLHMWATANVVWDVSRMLQRKCIGKLNRERYVFWLTWSRTTHQRCSTGFGQGVLEGDFRRGTEPGRRIVSWSPEPSLSSGKCLMSHQPLTSVLSSLVSYWHLGERFCNTKQAAVDSTLDNREMIQENQLSLTRVTNGNQQDKNFEIKGILFKFIQKIKKYFQVPGTLSSLSNSHERDLGRMNI